MVALTVPVRRLPHGQGLPLPAPQSAEAAGADLVAAVPVDDPLILPPGGRALVPTGIVVEIPSGFEGQVRPRSGLAVNHGVTVLNAPGTIDADYRGELRVVLINHGSEPFRIERGMRIAQLLVAPVAQAAFEPATALSSTDRGDSGFGSTGTGG
ncbi:dUTP diphosphatase [Bauldia sp.]|uniref:dUTP diphosphatase n=1 Tax=Bauldia sp. TaxID=2575872 RepID=UPI003BA93ADA